MFFRSSLILGACIGLATPASSSPQQAMQKVGTAQPAQAVPGHHWFFVHMERSQTPLVIGPFNNQKQCEYLKRFAITHGSESFSGRENEYVKRYSPCWQS